MDGLWAHSTRPQQCKGLSTFLSFSAKCLRLMCFFISTIKMVEQMAKEWQWVWTKELCSCVKKKPSTSHPHQVIQSATDMKRRRSKSYTFTIVIMDGFCLVNDKVGWGFFTHPRLMMLGMKWITYIFWKVWPNLLMIGVYWALSLPCWRIFYQLCKFVR